MTTETKFTPGPWAVYSDDEVYSKTAKNSDGNPLVVVGDSQCARDEYDNCFVSRRESKANAHLIAAAPDLLESLTNLVGLAKLGAARLDKYHAALSDAEAALAKARGGS